MCMTKDYLHFYKIWHTTKDKFSISFQLFSVPCFNQSQTIHCPLTLYIRMGYLCIILRRNGITNSTFSFKADKLSRNLSQKSLKSGLSIRLRLSFVLASTLTYSWVTGHKFLQRITANVACRILHFYTKPNCQLYGIWKLSIGNQECRYMLAMKQWHKLIYSWIHNRFTCKWSSIPVI